MEPSPLLVASVGFTLLHATEETFWGKGAPLWEAFGFITESELPDWLGFLLFFVGLVVAMIGVAWLGYGGSEFWCGVLVGGRLGDCWFSHWRPTLRGADVPGNWTTPLYVAESVWLVWWVGADVVGSGVGAMAFAVVLPAMRVLGWLQGRD